MHEKALLVPAVASALLALDSRAGARAHLRLSFLSAFAVLPLLPGPGLRLLKVCAASCSRGSGAVTGVAPFLGWKKMLPAVDGVCLLVLLA